jgi:hypothetical protein
MLPASLWLPCATHLNIVIAQCLTRDVMDLLARPRNNTMLGDHCFFNFHSTSVINITILGTFLLVPTRASRALASLSVIQTDLLSAFNNLFDH